MANMFLVLSRVASFTSFGGRQEGCIAVALNLLGGIICDQNLWVLIYLKFRYLLPNRSSLVCFLLTKLASC